MSPRPEIDAELDDLARRHLLRRRRTVRGAQGAEVEVEGRRVLCLASNNYLGLAADERVILGAIAALAEVGAGAGASPLISGHMEEHAMLEAEIAGWLGAEAAVLFGSGYHANIGAIAALVGTGDAVFSDELNHASLIDGCRLSRAAVHVYPHRDVAALDRLLAASTARRRLVVTDAVFSMDGTRAPLDGIVEVAERHGAWILLDEAHTIGVFGDDGGGLAAALGLGDRVLARMGTLGKALGSYGAFIAGPRALVDLLLNRARAYVFSTALPPPVVAAARTALAISRAEPARRERLWANARRLHERLAAGGLDVRPLESPIVPVVVGASDAALACAALALAGGVLAPAIRPPTVPAGTARLRLTPIASHDGEQVDRAAEVVLRAVAGALARDAAEHRGDA